MDLGFYSIRAYNTIQQRKPTLKLKYLITTAAVSGEWSGRNGDDGAVVRRSGEAGADGGAARPLHNLLLLRGGSCSNCKRECAGGADAVRARRQEDEEREAIQRVVRKRSAEEGEEDRAH